MLLLCAGLVLAGVPAPVVGQSLDREPNDSAADAVTISLGETVTGTIDRPNGDFQDWYTLELTERARLTISASHDPTNIHFIYVRTETAVRTMGVLQTDEPGPTEITSPVVFEPGTYYVTVWGLGTDYEFTVAATPVRADGTSSQDGTGVVNTGPSARAPDASATDSVGDWRSVVVMGPWAQTVERERVSKALIRLEPEASSSVTITDIELSGPDAAEFDWRGLAVGQRFQPGEVVTFEVRFSPTAPEAKQATLSVTFSDGDVTRYELSGFGVTPDAYEDNEEFDTASPVAPGSHQAALAGPMDVDFYAYDLRTGDQVTVTLSNEYVVPLDYFLAAPGPARQTDIVRVESGRDATSEFVARRDGTYYVVVGAAVANSTIDTDLLETEVPYTLRIDVTEPTRTSTSTAESSGPARTSTQFPGFGALGALLAVALFGLGAAWRRGWGR